MFNLLSFIFGQVKSDLAENKEVETVTNSTQSPTPQNQAFPLTVQRISHRESLRLHFLSVNVSQGEGEKPMKIDVTEELAKDFLTKMGYKIYVKHQRYFPEITKVNKRSVPITRMEAEKFFQEQGRTLSKIKNAFSPFGGITTVSLVAKDGTEYQGVSKCSLKDVFCHANGRVRALERALENAKISLG